jgi:hypothetical protein
MLPRAKTEPPSVRRVFPSKTVKSACAISFILVVARQCELHDRSVNSREGRIVPTSTTVSATTRLLITVPFTARDIDRVKANLIQWASIGPVCSNSPSGTRLAELWFYYNQGPEKLPSEFYGHIRRLQSDHIVTPCFSRISVTYANLTEAEDEYPSGINLMFFRLLKGVGFHEQLSNFHALYWMEPDVQPIKPYWLNVLVRESLSSDYWIKGSIYLGEMFDHMSGGDTWIGHINGNALYRLHQPDFVEFLDVVIDMEPPSHIWKPFDVSIWKVLHDFPYFWHAHQRIASRFIYSDFVHNWGNSVSNDGFAMSQSSAKTVLIHGSVTSAGSMSFESKFKGNKHPSRGVNWDGAVNRARETISVLIRAQNMDVEFTRLALKSIHAHMRGVLEVVVAVPASDLASFDSLLEEFDNRLRIAIVPEDPLSHAYDHAMQDAYTRLLADKYCAGDFIFNMRPDSVLLRKIYHKYLFFGGKPIARYRDEPLPDPWRSGLFSALGPRLDSPSPARADEQLIPRWSYNMTRSYLEKRHKKTVKSFLNQRVRVQRCLLADRTACPLTKRRRLRGDAYSHIITMRTYLYNFNRSAMTWLPIETSQQYTNTALVPLIPTLTCQGDAWLATKLSSSDNELRLLRDAYKSGNCGPLIGQRQQRRSLYMEYLG